MIVCVILHQATAMWDVAYADKHREIPPIEQHVHSVLEMVPLTGLLMVGALNVDAVAGFAHLKSADFGFRLSNNAPDWRYVAIVLSAAVLFEILPYCEELIRGIRKRER